MKFYTSALAFSVTLLVAACLVRGRSTDRDSKYATLTHDSKQMVSRIVAGENSAQRSYFVRVINMSRDGSEEYVCGGSVIDNTYVLTAAHCVEPVDGVAVAVGDFSVEDRPTVFYRNLPFIIHKEYRINGDIHNDIALIKLCDMVTGKNLNLPSLQPCGSGKKSQANRYTIIGMGQTRPNSMMYNAKYPKVLQVAEQMESNGDAVAKKCGLMSPFDILKMICLVDTLEGDKAMDSCKQDSGSPVLIKEGNQECQYGVISRGPVTCDGSGSINFRISYYEPWIRATKEKLDKIKCPLKQ